ncbi:histidine kinase [Streptosporangium sp. NPDC051023]|uniref:sensor histidine kinase n=1 Tax=Streptosporangium sp. NPDC051023 TaxID=3155410 RepID=UPI00344F8B92
MTARREDLAITVVAVLAAVLPLLVPEPRTWWLFGLAVLSSAPVYWRRDAPILTCVLVGTATSVMVLWEKPLLPLGPLVCLYTIAAQSTRAQRLAVIPATVVFVTVSLIVPHEKAETYRYVAVAYVAAYALGTGARARRAQAAELEERERRLASEREAAAAEERTRIARDVHDIVTHSVGLMVVQAEAGPVALKSDPARGEAAFDTIGEIGRSALVQLRGLLGTLRAGEERPERPGLDALPELIARIGRAGVRVELASLGDARPVSPEVDVAAYRIVQEALTNVLRHSGARAVLVRLAWADALRLEISDDGDGTRGQDGGHGLAGMRERALASGGTFSAGQRPGGFTVSAELPVGG